MNNFPSLHCRAMWCRSNRIYATKKRETVHASTPAEDVGGFSKIVRQCERIGNETDRRWIRKKMKMIKKKKEEKRK